MAKKIAAKKPRTEQVVIGFKDKYLGIKFDENDNSILVKTLDGQWVNPDSISSETSYKKQSGNSKSIYEITGHAVMGEEAMLKFMAKQFDVVFAIDTNTNTIENIPMSISVVYLAKFEENSSKHSINIKFRSNGTFFFNNCPKASAIAEKAGWLKLIELIGSHPEYKNQRIAILTDHDKGNHEKINTRKMPFFLSHILPKNITMMYSGSDTPNDSILNKLIKKCDSEAGNLLNELAKSHSCSVYGTNVPLEFNLRKDGDKYSCSKFLPENW